ncbi:MAG: TRAP transporter substrate-binding protein [Proteobacteria bacterium]|nr:TRAP transporter substrate-binding protein [Pseudomonadota bacterium]
MRPTRRMFLTATAATAAAAAMRPRAARAEEELKLSTFVPPSHIIYARVLVPWAAELEKRSAGKLKIRFFPSMQLGGKPPELYRQMAQGVSDITFTLPGYTSGDFPMMALTELPAMAKSADDGTKKLWANYDKYLARDFQAAKVLMLWNSDTAAIMSKAKPVRTLDDLKGMKIRTPSAAQSAQLVALGATPIDMPAPAIYNALDRGVVDATMIPMSAALDFKLVEVAKYFTVDAPLGRSPFLVAMNKARYERLAPDLKKVLDETTGLSLSLKGAATYDEQNNAAIAAVEKDKDRDLIKLSDAEHKRWFEAFRPLIQSKAQEADKAGLPGSALVGAYGVLG